jgi:asparagine synthase (glutamine-hydrolysing)
MSLFKNVQRVPPGTSLLVTRERLDKRVDWQLSADLIGTGPRDPNAAAEELKCLLEEAVRSRAAGEQPLATHLSGGLDSSAVTLLAARFASHKNRMHAYSMLPSEAREHDATTEWPYVKAVLAKCRGLIWSPVFSGEGMTLLRPAMDSDQLVPVSSGWPDAGILERAGADGAAKLLTGWGGDEGASFNGRGVLIDTLVRGQWHYLARIAKPGWRALTAEIARQFLSPDAMRRIRRAASLPTLSDQAKTGAWFLSSQLQSLPSEPATLSRVGSARLRYALLRSSHLWERAEAWNLNAAHHGMVILFPLLDRRIVEFAVSLPGTVFIRDGKRRWLFRQAMRDVLPPQLLDRRSKFRPIDDIATTLQRSTRELHDWVERLKSDALVSAYLDVERIESQLEAIAGAEGREIAAPGFFKVLQLAAFLEQHNKMPAVRAA